MTRPFTSEERSILLRLAETAPGKEVLLAHIDAAQYGEPWFADSLSFSIVIDEDVPPYTEGEDIGLGRQLGPYVSVRVNGSLPDSDENYVGEMFLWFQDGVLSDLEYSWLTEEMPSQLPRLDQLVD